MIFSARSWNEAPLALHYRKRGDRICMARLRKDTSGSSSVILTILAQLRKDTGGSSAILHYSAVRGCGRFWLSVPIG
jgi:hypothetical protein